MGEISISSVPEIFGTNVRRIREMKEWSQSELARRMVDAGWSNYRQMTVSRTEDGTRTPRLDEAIALAAVFACRLEDLLSSGSTYQQILAKVGAAEEIREELSGYEEEALEASFRLGVLLNDLERLITTNDDDSVDLSKVERGIRLYKQLRSESKYAFAGFDSDEGTHGNH